MAAPAPRKAYNPQRLRLSHVPVWLLGMLVAVVWAMPFVWMVSTSFKLPEHVMTEEIEWFPRVVTLENYVKVFEFPILRWAFNSLVQAGVSTALCVLFGAMAGYALARMRFPGNGLLFAVFIASLMIPAEVTVVPLLLAVIKMGWASTYAALIVPTIANVFSVYIFRQYFLTFPSELEDAARMDGAGPFRTFFLIALPMARAGGGGNGGDIHTELEQLPLATAGDLPRGHENPSGGGGTVRTRRRLAAASGSTPTFGTLDFWRR
jgi:multiple sugar transport system permease protein